MTKYVMNASITGTVDGEDWPKVGEPAPASLRGDDLDQAVAHGWVVEAAVKSTSDVETATVSAEPKPRTRKGLTRGDL